MTRSLGTGPVHFDVILGLNICITMIMPSFGQCLSVAPLPFDRSVELATAGLWPFIMAILLVLALTSYVPQISTVLLALVR